jgi:putative ABC transport system permease protein
LVAVLTLALGIGVNTGIFSAMNATVLRPLPYKDPKQLVMVWGVERSGCCRHGGVVFSAPNFLDVKEQNRVFENMGAFHGASFTLSNVEHPENVRAGSVTADFFEVLAAQPTLGRTFLSEEGAAGRAHVVVLSYGLWQRRFSSDPKILGQTIQLDANPYTVIGVMPPDFDFSIPDYYGPMDLWVPAVLTRDNSQRAHNYLNVIARLKPSVAIRQAQADMSDIVARLAREYPQTSATGGAPLTGAQPEMQEHSGAISGAKLEPLHDEIFGDVTPLLWILFGAVGFVLLIACANVASLQLTRASAREKEVAVRMALGADRKRVVRQFLTESVILALIGGALSLVLASWGMTLLTQLSVSALPHATSIKVDFSVLAYSLIVSLATGVLFGLAPVFSSSSVNLTESLKQGGRTTGANDGARRLRSLLTVSEVALSVILLIGAGLLIRSFVGLLNVKPGFETQNILTLRVFLPKYSYPDAKRQAALYTQLLDRIRTLPGVKAAAAINDLPLTSDRDSDAFNIEGHAPRDPSGNTGNSQDRLVTSDYFRVMRIPLIKGRTFTTSDTSSAPPVVVISQSFAHHFFQNEDPVGHQLTFGAPTALASWATIVGVVGDVRDLGLDAQPDIDIYAHYEQSALPYNPLSSMSLVVCTIGDPNGISDAMLGEIRTLDKDLPLPSVEAMADVYAASISARRFNMLVLGIFAVISIALAGVGIYGVISYSVAQRTHEIGVRMALGAQRGDVLRMVVGQGLLLTGTGVAIGVVGAFGLTRFLAGFLYQVHPLDTVTFAGVVVLLEAVALLASYLPACRATEVDPIAALKYE